MNGPWGIDTKLVSFNLARSSRNGELFREEHRFEPR